MSYTCAYFGHKTLHPPPRPGIVPRPRLVERLNESLAVLDFAQPGAPIIFSCGWHITRDGKNVYPPSLKREEKIVRWLTRIVPFADMDDQVEACQRVFASNTRWTVVRGSDLEEGESQGLPVWSRHVGDPILQNNRTRRVDYPFYSPLPGA